MSDRTFPSSEALRTHDAGPRARDRLRWCHAPRHRREVGGTSWRSLSRSARTTVTWQLILSKESCFTHLTSAAVRGWCATSSSDGNARICSSMDCRISPAHRPGLIVSRHPTEPTVEVAGWAGPRHGTRDPARLRSGSGSLDLVVLMDSALHAGACTMAELSLIAQQRRRGAPNLRKALALADSRSESPWESMLRILHITCGIPVEPQYVVRNPAGGFVARGDLWIVGTRTLHEYDGAHHLSRPQQRRDLRRSGRIDDVDWSRRGFTKEDVLHQSINILRAADAALGRPHDPQRIRAWHAHLRDSLQTPAGMARFRARLQLPHY